MAGKACIDTRRTAGAGQRRIDPRTPRRAAREPRRGPRRPDAV